MQAADADRQITQMIEFLKQEAREKAEEIYVKTEAEFNAKKLGQIVKARGELKEEYAQKRKDVAAKKRIARSRLINSARFEQMRERDQILKELKQQIFSKLVEVASHFKYPEFVQALLVQGLLTILEKNVEVRCREIDQAVVKKVLPAAVQEFKQIVKQETGVDPDIEVTLSTKDFLSPPPSRGYNGPTCAGGVTLVARHGKIICRNTLDARFDKAFQELLPEVRNTIFGKRGIAKVAKKVEEEKHH